MAKLSTEEEERALEIHRKAIIIDALTTIPVMKDNEYFQVMLKAGLTATNVAV